MLRFSENSNSNYYNPITFGCELYKHGEIPYNFCKAEFDLIYSIY